MDSKWYFPIILCILALASLAAAVVLELTGNDATHAWEGFALIVAFLVGVHVPAPSQP
jgi:hypothetical protein